MHILLRLRLLLLLMKKEALLIHAHTGVSQNGTLKGTMTFKHYGVWQDDFEKLLVRMPETIETKGGVREIMGKKARILLAHGMTMSCSSRCGSMDPDCASRIRSLHSIPYLNSLFTFWLSLPV